LSSFDDPPFGRPSPVTFSYRRLRTRHLSHDTLSAFAFSLVFPSLVVHLAMRQKPPTTLAQNLQRRSDAVLDQPLVDKIHSPPTAPSRPVVLWAPVTRSFENTHLSRTYFSVIQRRTLELLVALDVISDLFPASLPSDLTEFTARHTTCENHVWIDHFCVRGHAIPPSRNQLLFTTMIFPFAYHTNLTSASTLRPSP